MRCGDSVHVWKKTSKVYRHMWFLSIARKTQIQKLHSNTVLDFPTLSRYVPSRTYPRRVRLVLGCVKRVIVLG